ncbi:MAG: hypothetical protein IT376_05360 [Polyangiaceae bacterium]|nr:hypothetical protein [Polyangiaceae bacterium]
MPIEVFVASHLAQTTELEPRLAFTRTPAEGSAIVVAMTFFSDTALGAIPADGVSDNQGNTYDLVAAGAPITSQPTHAARGYLFLARGIGPVVEPFEVVARPTIGGSPHFQQMTWGALEVTGLAPTGVVDRTGSAPSTACCAFTNVATGGPTLQRNELAVGVLSMRSNDPDVQLAPETGWEQPHVWQDGQSVGNPHSLVWRIVAEPEVVTHTWTHDVPTRGASAILATLRGVDPR